MNFLNYQNANFIPVYFTENCMWPEHYYGKKFVSVLHPQAYNQAIFPKKFSKTHLVVRYKLQSFCPPSRKYQLIAARCIAQLPHIKCTNTLVVLFQMILNHSHILGLISFSATHFLLSLVVDVTCAIQ